MIWPILAPLAIAMADGYAFAANSPLAAKVVLSVTLAAIVIRSVADAARRYLP
jgi:hypothetical protein